MQTFVAPAKMNQSIDQWITHSLKFCKTYTKKLKTHFCYGSLAQTNVKFITTKQILSNKLHNYVKEDVVTGEHLLEDVNTSIKACCNTVDMRGSSMKYKAFQSLVNNVCQSVF